MLQINTINLLLGDPSECSLDLKYSPSNDNSVDYMELSYFKYCSDKVYFNNIQSISKATIVPRESKLHVEFDHFQPALAGEWYAIVVNLQNDELFDIRDLKIEVTLEDETNEGKYSWYSFRISMLYRPIEIGM